MSCLILVLSKYGLIVWLALKFFLISLYMPEEAEEAKPSRKKRPKSKSKHKKVQIWKLYKVEGDKVIRLRESCPRCGAGTFLARYKNRTWCGRCGWARIEMEKSERQNS